MSQREYDRLVAERTSREHEANIQAQQRHIQYIQRRNTLAQIQSETAEQTERSSDSDTRTLSYNPTTPTTSSNDTLPQIRTPSPTTNRTMANQKQIVPPNFPFFSGDLDDDKAEKPNIWLRRFELLWEPTAMDEDRITTFALVLESDSTAEEWWSKLDAGRKTPWVNVKAEFKTED